MKKETLNDYLGENVEITFFDDKKIQGVLGFTPEFSEKYDFRKPNYYTVANLDFKPSHIKKLKVLL